MRSKITLFVFAVFTILQSTAQIIVKAKRIEVPSAVPVVSLDVTDLNHNPDMAVIIEREKTITDTNIKRDPYAFNARYNSMTGRYEVAYVDAGESFEAGDKLNIIYAPTDTAGSENGNFFHDASSSTFNPGVNYATIIDNPLTNDDDAWRFIVGSWFGIGDVAHDQVVNPYYDFFGTKEWVLKSDAGFNIQTDSRYALIGDTSDIFKYTHTTTTGNTGKVLNSATQFSFFTTLSHTDIDGNPDIIVFVEPFVETGSSFQEFLFESSTYYNDTSDKWEFHIEMESFPGSDYNFPSGINLNVFALNETLSVDEISKKDIRAFPNPTNTVVKIQANTPITKVSIFNILGQKLTDFKGNNRISLEIDVSHYKSGHYFTRVETETSIETLKLFKE